MRSDDDEDAAICADCGGLASCSLFIDGERDYFCTECAAWWVNHSVPVWGLTAPDVDDSDPLHTIS